MDDPRIILGLCAVVSLLLLWSIAYAAWPLKPPQNAVARARATRVEEPPADTTQVEAAQQQPEPPKPAEKVKPPVKTEVAQAAPPPIVMPQTPTVPQTTALKLKRSQRDGLFGKVIFILDARMELSPDDAAKVSKYKLGSRVVYESSARQRHAEAAKAHAEGTRGASASRTMLGVGLTLAKAAQAALSLRITIDSLSKGVHVECKSLEEMTEAENAIVEAAKNLKGYLAAASGFDGKEEVFEL
jgi:hypothetical protein